MYWSGFLVLFTLNRLSLTLPVRVDTKVIQLQQWVVLDAQRVSGQVLVNWFPYTGITQELNGIIQRMSVGLIPLNLLANHTGILRKGQTMLRSRNCILNGSELHWTDQVFSNGSLYLSSDHGGVWVAHTPQAMALKALWEQAIRSLQPLQDECVNLMGNLRFSEDQSDSRDPMPQFLIPILVLLSFIMVTALSFLLYNKQGLLHPGGVIGSIIHYTKEREVH
ncbi:uncharacterized protein LOC144085582 [Stigmatopora argus]